MSCSTFIGMRTIRVYAHGEIHLPTPVCRLFQGKAYIGISPIEPGLLLFQSLEQAENFLMFDLEPDVDVPSAY